MDTLSTRGRTARVAVAALGALLLLLGTFWGQDDDFPFGPFRMYSTAPDPDADAPDTRVEGEDATGATIVLTEANSGIRRAEFEGQQQQYVDDPGRLQQVAVAYTEKSPAAPPLTTVRIVIRWQGIEHARIISADSHDEVVAAWTVSR